MNCAAEIKQSVSMQDVLNHYGIDTSRSGRIPCPLHHGKDKNFAYKDRSFKCFVCGASGTVLDFVMAYQGTDLSGAEQYLNDQFGLNLPIGRTASRKEQTELERKARLRRLERERNERELERLRIAYDKALTRWVRLDRIISEKAPDGPLDAPDAEWVDAMKNIDEAAHELNRAETNLVIFERSV